MKIATISRLDQRCRNTRDHARSEQGLTELYIYGRQLVAAQTPSSPATT